MAYSDELARYIEGRMRRAVEHVGQAWAQATRDEIARTASHTGALGQSVQFTVTGPTEGELVMRGYGKAVAEGVPGATIPVLSQAARNVRYRQRYARAVGRVVQHPNPFPERAKASQAVQDAMADAPNVLFE